MSFEVIGCQLMNYGPDTALPNRVRGIVRVRIREVFMGNRMEYALDLKVKADCGRVSSSEVRTALLTHAAHQLNKLKARHDDHKLPVAAE